MSKHLISLIQGRLSDLRRERENATTQRARYMTLADNCGRDVEAYNSEIVDLVKELERIGGYDVKTGPEVVMKP